LPPTPAEIVETGRAIERPEAARRREATRASDGQGTVGGSGGANVPLPAPGKTGDKVGEAHGVSGKTYDKAKRVVGHGGRNWWR
jgi:hypothetical protein